MKDFLTTWAERWQALAARDRRALLMGSGLIIAVLLVGGLMSLQDGSAAAAQRLQQKRILLANLPDTLDRLRRIDRLGTDAALPLGTLARRLVEISGLSADVQTSADGGAVLQLTEVPFDGAVELIAEVAAHGLVLRTARIDAGGKPGMVNAHLELAPRISPSR